MKLNNLKATAGSRRPRKRLGCGIGSGHGKTAGRGHKGQKSRTGGSIARGFEGGQMPLIRRLPKRGFTSMAKGYQVVNVSDLARFEAGSVVNAEVLEAAGLIRDAVESVKLLANGEVDVALTVEVSAVSAAAAKKIETAGGSVRTFEG